MRRRERTWYGARRIGPGRWEHRPGARWVPDDDPTIGWDRPKPIYPEVEPVDEHKLAIDIVATRGAIRGFEYKIATDIRFLPGYVHRYPGEPGFYQNPQFQGDEASYGFVGNDDVFVHVPLEHHYELICRYWNNGCEYSPCDRDELKDAVRAYIWRQSHDYARGKYCHFRSDRASYYWTLRGPWG